MDKQEVAIARAEEASRILHSQLWANAWDDTRRAILETWAQLPTADSENARDLHRMLKALDRVRRCFEIHIDSGKIAVREIEGRKRLPTLQGMRNALQQRMQ